VGDRDVVFPYMYALHDDTRPGAVLRLMLTRAATPCARMTRGRGVAPGPSPRERFRPRRPWVDRP
jgi:hypothetical protein